MATWARKRPSTFSAQDSGKQQKKSISTVAYHGEQTALKAGVELAGTYSLIGEQKSLTDIKDNIDGIGDQFHNIEGQVFIFHNAFKAALKHLLTMVYDNDTDMQPMILIHGVPSVGKSSLAANLAYHLALTDTDATLVKFDNTLLHDKDRLAQSYLTQNAHGYVIFDQLDVNQASYQKFAQMLTCREINAGKLPIVAFTSGHAPPHHPWSDSPFILHLVIDMKTDADGVIAAKKYFQFDEKMPELDPNLIVKVSTVFGHVMECVVYAMGRSHEITLEEFQEHIYKIPEFYTVASLKPNVFWSLFPQFCTASDKEIELKKKPEDWQLKPEKVQLLGSILGSMKDPQDTGTMCYLNWLHIKGDEEELQSGEASGYCEYRRGNYYYYFPCLSKLHAALKSVYKHVSKCEMFNEQLRLYELYSLSPSFTGSFRSWMFERLISLRCAAEGERYRRAATGIGVISDSTAVLIEVQSVITPDSPDELCRLAEEKRASNTGRQIVWCDLNASRNDFPGYDFVVISLDDQQYVTFHLLEATVSPKTHKINAMISVYEKVKAKCREFKGTGKVQLCFLCPHSYRDSQDVKHTCKEGTNTNVYALPVVNMQKLVPLKDIL